MKFYRGTQNKPHGASTPGITFVAPTPARAAQWGELAGDGVIEVWELDIPDDVRVVYTIGGWIKESNLVLEWALPLGERELMAIENRAAFVRWGYACDVPQNAYEVRIEEPFRFYPQRLVALVEYDYDRDCNVWLTADNKLERIA